MIKVGDIVFRKYKGGLLNNQPDDRVIGLVIKEHEKESVRDVAQFQVRFGLDKEPRWYYQHELYRINLGRKKDA